MNARFRYAIASVPEDAYEFYDTIHKRGCFVFHMLRMILGEEEFWQLLHAYFETHIENGGNSGYREFVGMAEAIHGGDLEWFFAPWLFGTDIPRFVVRVERASSSLGTPVLRFALRQESSFPKLPLPVEILTTSGRTEHLLWASGREHQCQLPVSSRPRSVTFNGGLSTLLSLSHEAARSSAPWLRVKVW